MFLLGSVLSQIGHALPVRLHEAGGFTGPDSWPRVWIIQNQRKLEDEGERIPTMEQHGFYYFDDYRGHHRKGIAIYNAANVNLKPKPCFH